MFQISHSVKLTLLSLAVPTAVGLLYYLLKTGSDEDYDDSFYGDTKNKEATSRQTVIEMKIPRKLVGTVIGRQGATIKEVQEKSGARVNFKDDTQQDDGDRTVTIRGTSEAAQHAESLIRKILADLPVIVQEQVEVPSYALGRIIGRGGESIRQMSRASQTKIFVDRARNCYRDKPQLITISGTQEQIIVAKDLIQEKLDQEEEFRARTAVSAANRETRKKTKDYNVETHGMTEHSIDNEVVKKSSEAVHVESNNKTTDEEDSNLYLQFPKQGVYVEVYVSAIANPGHFWVQTIGIMALQLDKLSNTMTGYYDGPGKGLALSSVKIGDIVAAPFENDRTWYRAKVMEIKDSELDLFYVDYGDSAFMDIKFVKPLDSEYLTLPFQAIECRLSGVKPAGSDGWTEEAFDKFEALTYCAKWKVIMAKAIKFDGCIPHLELIDTNKTPDVNINEELIRSGFAVPDT